MPNQSEQDFWGQENSEPENKNTTQTWIIALIMVLFFVVSSFAGFKVVNHWLGGPGISNTGDTGESISDVVAKDKDKKMSILLLGIDQRNNEPGRADTIILAFLDLDQKNMKLLSIPRDTYAQIPGYRKEKIAHANAYGGPELTVATVEDLLDIQIDRYVELNFEGFKKMIDKLGGIEMEVEKRMYYPPEDIDLHAGMQRLNGHDALAYVRFRNDPQGDIGRVKRQQKFLKELAEETLQLGTIFKIPDLIKEANQSIATNISATEMLSLTKAAKSFDSKAIEAATLPGTPEYINKVSYWIPAGNDVQEIIDQYTSPKQTAKNEVTDPTVN